MGLLDSTVLEIFWFLVKLAIAIGLFAALCFILAWTARAVWWCLCWIIAGIAAAIAWAFSSDRYAR